MKKQKKKKNKNRNKNKKNKKTIKIMQDAETVEKQLILVSQDKRGFSKRLRMLLSVKITRFMRVRSKYKNTHVFFDGKISE